MQLNSSMLSTFAYQTLVDIIVLFHYVIAKPVIQEPGFNQVSADLMKSCIPWEERLFYVFVTSNSDDKTQRQIVISPSCVLYNFSLFSCFFSGS